MDFFSTNPFDLAIYICLFLAVVMGFMTGLLRSLATIMEQWAWRWRQRRT